METKRLRGKIVERYGTQERFAKEILGIRPATLTEKMQGRSEWSQGEIAKAIDALDLTPGDAFAIFFADDVAIIHNTREATA